MKNKLLVSLLCATAIGGSGFIGEGFSAGAPTTWEIPQSNFKGKESFVTGSIVNKAINDYNTQILQPALNGLSGRIAELEKNKGSAASTASEIDRNKAATTIQTKFRGQLEQKKFKKLKDSAAKLKTVLMMNVAQKKFKSMKEAAAAESKKLELQQAQLTAQMEALLAQQSELSGRLLALDEKSSEFKAAKESLQSLRSRYETERSQLSAALEKLNEEREGIEALATEYDEKVAEANAMFAAKTGSIYKKAVKAVGDSDDEKLKAEILRILIDDEEGLLQVPAYRAQRAELDAGLSALADDSKGLGLELKSAQSNFDSRFNDFETNQETERKALQGQLDSLEAPLSTVKASIGKLPVLASEDPGVTSATSKKKQTGTATAASSNIDDVNSSTGPTLEQYRAHAKSKLKGNLRSNAAALQTTEEFAKFFKDNGITLG